MMTASSRRFLMFGAAAALAVAGAASGASVVSCTGDTNADLKVDSTDLNVLLGEFGQSGGALQADLDNNGSVNSTDLNMLLATFGSCHFDYGPSFDDAEALQIGLEMLGPDGPLTLPQDIYDHVLTDLVAIRALAPALDGQTHTMAWANNQLLVSVPNALGSGPLDAYNEFFSVVEADDNLSFGGNTYWLITFAAPVNVEALAVLYGELDGVNFAEPNGLIGGQNFYSPVQGPGGVWTWTIDDGFHDCFDGCDCHTVYEFTADGEGNADLISQDQFGLPWCEFPA